MPEICGLGKTCFDAAICSAVGYVSETFATGRIE
jgi:hypothetical protein